MIIKKKKKLFFYNMFINQLLKIKIPPIPNKSKTRNFEPLYVNKRMAFFRKISL